MGTTTKMAIPYPEATGLVKDGWEDMKDIATQVDAKSGLVLINSTSFSAVSSQSVNDVFSANYASYRIIVRAVGSTTADGLQFRFRVGGADNTATNYRRQDLNADGTSITGARTTGGTSWQFGVVQSATQNFNILEILNPFQAFKPTGHSIRNYDTTANLVATQFSLGLDVDTSYTGFTIFPGSGTMTGNVSVYGYNQ